MALVVSSKSAEPVMPSHQSRAQPVACGDQAREETRWHQRCNEKDAYEES